MKLTVLIHAPLIVISISLTNATSTEKLVNRQSDIECPAGSSLCVYFSGESCVDTSVGDVCCADGSGVCSGGFDCGTGVAADRCCQPGTTPEECAQATLVGSATFVSAIATPTSEPQSANSASLAMHLSPAIWTWALLLTTTSICAI